MSANLGQSCLATKISAPGPSSYGWFRHNRWALTGILSFDSGGFIFGPQDLDRVVQGRLGARGGSAGHRRRAEAAELSRTSPKWCSRGSFGSCSGRVVGVRDGELIRVH